MLHIFFCRGCKEDQSENKSSIKVPKSDPCITASSGKEKSFGNKILVPVYTMPVRDEYGKNYTVLALRLHYASTVLI